MIVKEISSITLAFAVLFAGFAQLEPNVVGAQESPQTDTVIVNLTVGSGIAITSPADVTMSGMGTLVDTSTGSATWNVKTNNNAGYSLGVKASTSPALRNASNSFENYATTTPTVWSVPSTKYQFGFSGIGTSVQSLESDPYAATGQTHCDNGTASSTVNTNLKFRGFTTSDVLLASGNAPTGTAGTDSKICFAAGQNGVYAPSGVYQATITATATAL